MRLSDLEGKKVLVWGAAREGSAFMSAAVKAGISMQLVVADEDDTPGREFEGHPVRRISQDWLDWADVVVRSPGVSRYRPDLQGILTTTATNLWFGEPHAPTIAVTGTKGKSTTSTLISRLLEAVGLRATLAGNIGQNPLDLYGQPQPDWWVLELSSYQISDLQYSPQIGVLTNLSPEHLDWHGGYDVYVRDKLNLFAHDPGMTSVVNGADPGVVEIEPALPNRIEACVESGIHVRDGYFYAGGQQLFGRDRLSLRGPHNEQLACLALAAIVGAGVDILGEQDALADAMTAMEPLPHRLQPVETINDVIYVNDSLSTTPVASIAAVRSFEGRPITLLMGGHDRGLSYDEFAKFVVENADRVRIVTLPDSGKRIRDAIEQAVAGSSGVTPPEVSDASDLDDAVRISQQSTPAGGVVLLSPGAASFGHFRNYAHRGEVFEEAVRKLAHS